MTQLTPLQNQIAEKVWNLLDDARVADGAGLLTAVRDRVAQLGSFLVLWVPDSIEGKNKLIGDLLAVSNAFDFDFKAAAKEIHENGLFDTIAEYVQEEGGDVVDVAEVHSNFVQNTWLALIAELKVLRDENPDFRTEFNDMLAGLLGHKQLLVEVLNA